MSQRIVRCKFGILNSPLIRPYELSFATLTNIKSVWVYIEDEKGCKGIGEATPLPGYGSETVEDVANCIRDLCRDLHLLTRDDIQRRCCAVKSRYPFSASAVMMALEFPLFASKIQTIRPIPIVYPLSSKQDMKSLLDTVRYALKTGYKFFKMKVGNGLQKDIESSRQVLSAFPSTDYVFSFDSNQAYSFEDALFFCRTLESEWPHRVLLLEQPFLSADWESMAKLCSKAKVKLMLDESIYDETDIEQAKRIGCHAVKLKLCKHFGLEGTLTLARKAKALGLHVVIGNGVSTEIGNLGEALVLSYEPDLFSYGAECNGYLKLCSSVVFKELKFDKGYLVWRSINARPTEQFDKAIDNFINSVSDASTN